MIRGIIIKHSERAVRISYVVCPNDGSEQPHLQQQVWHIAAYICGYW